MNLVSTDWKTHQSQTTRLTRQSAFSDTKVGHGEKKSPRQDGVADAEDGEAGIESYPPQRQQTQQTASSETAEGTGFVSARDHEEDDLDELEGGLDDHAFHHPALYKHQPIVSAALRIRITCRESLRRSGYLETLSVLVTKLSRVLELTTSISRIETRLSMTRERSGSRETRFRVRSLTTDRR